MYATVARVGIATVCPNGEACFSGQDRVQKNQSTMPQAAAIRTLEIIVPMPQMKSIASANCYLTGTGLAANASPSCRSSSMRLRASSLPSASDRISHSHSFGSYVGRDAPRQVLDALATNGGPDGETMCHLPDELRIRSRRAIRETYFLRGDRTHHRLDGQSSGRGC